MIRAPDTAKIKQKMVYAASKDALRRKLDGIYTEIQCTDLAEVSHETVLDKVYFFNYQITPLTDTGYSHDLLSLSLSEHKRRVEPYF